MGLGLSGGAWWRTVDALAPQLRVITFDNRGIGRSNGLAPAYATEAMADDAVAILDGDRPRRRARLRPLAGGDGRPAAGPAPPAAGCVRSCSARPSRGPAGGPGRRRRHGVLPAPVEDAQGGGRLGLRRLQLRATCRELHVDRIADDIERRLTHPFSPNAYRAQLVAASLHNCLGRLDRIRVPTLVVHGEHDRVIPVGNAHLMAERLPDCRLRILEDSGHLYPTEEPSVDEEIAEFLAAAPDR